MARPVDQRSLHKTTPPPSAGTRLGQLRPDEREIEWVLRRLAWMQEEQIWPNGPRYLWTDAFGLVLLLSLHAETGESAYLHQADELVAEVDRVLGRDELAGGYRIGEAEDRDGQYFHYLTMWMFALWRLSRYRPVAREKAIRLVKQVHGPFVEPGVGVHWKMLEDLSSPYPDYGYGAIDAFDGYVSYTLLDEGTGKLAAEREQMRQLIERQYRHLHVDQDLGLGMMLWLCHWFTDDAGPADPNEPWAPLLRDRALRTLESMWRGPMTPTGLDDVGSGGYFMRHPGLEHVRYAFTNYGVGLSLQAVGRWPGRVEALHRYFDDYHSGDEYDRNAITHIMACCSHWPGLWLRNP